MISKQQYLTFESALPYLSVYTGKTLYNLVYRDISVYLYNILV